MHAATPFEIERDRLRLLEARYDEVTRTRLTMAGPLDGLRALEVGAGAGSVALMLAEMVGPDGEVVALDLDPRFLVDLDLPNLTVRRHDIVTDELERSCYDLVHCRALLLHLSDPVTALSRMIDSLRPGGLLLVEDADYSTFGAVPGHPASADFDRLLRTWGQRYLTDWTFDPRFGAKLPPLLAENKNLTWSKPVAPNSGNWPNSILKLAFSIESPASISFTCFTTFKKSAPARSILLTKPIRGTP